MGLFGQILKINIQYGSIVFIAVLFIILLFEGGLDMIEEMCEARGLNILLKKLYREFMIMGFISFALYIISDQYSFSDHTWFDAFHFAHLLMLFIGITFLFQSALFVSLISSRNMTLLRYDNHSSEDLLTQYIDFQKTAKILKFMFDYGPVSIPIPELREKIEFKIIQEYFIRSYLLPEEFKFANYMCLVLKDYVVGLVEVRPISWLLVSVLVVINYARSQLVDTHFHTNVCREYVKHQDQNSHTSTCPEYTLRYVLVCSIFMTLFLVSILCYSELYIRRVIDMILDVEEVLELYETFDEQSNQGAVFVSSSAKTITASQKSKHTYRSSSEDIEDQNDDSQSDISALPTVTFNRRHLYFKCLERIADLELDSHLNRARRSSTHRDPSILNESVGKTISDKSENVSFPVINSSQAKSKLSIDIQPEENEEEETQKSLLESNANESSPRRSSLRTRSTHIRELREDLIKLQTRSVRYSGSSKSRSDSPSEQCNVDGEQQFRVNGSSNFNYQTLLGKSPRSRKNSHASEDATQRLNGETGSTLLTANHSINDLRSELRKQVSLNTQRKSKHKGETKSMASNAATTSNAENEIITSSSTTEHSDAPKQSRFSFNFSLDYAYNKSKHNSRNELEMMSIANDELRQGKVPGPIVSSEDSTTTADRMERNGIFFKSPSPSIHDTRGESGPTEIVDRNEKEPKEKDLDYISHRRKNFSRRRSYSVEYFDLQHTLEEHQKQFNDESENSNDCRAGCCGRISACQKKLMHLALELRVFLLWLMRTVISALMGRKWHSNEAYGTIQITEDSYRKIFVFKSPTLYYLIIEIALLLQCVYIALWATNFAAIAADSENVILYQVFLLLPLPLNFFILKQIIFTSCMLKAVVKLDKDIADKICEDALDVRNVTQRLRKAVKTSLNDELDADSSIRSAFVRGKFMMASNHDLQRRINEKNFRVFLHSLKLFFTDASVTKIFSVIDFDQDGWVSWIDLRSILFPELQKKNVKLIRKSMVGNGRMSFDYSRQKSDDGEDDNKLGVNPSTSARSESNFYLSKIFGGIQLGRSKETSSSNAALPDEEESDHEELVEDKRGEESDLSEEDEDFVESMLASRSHSLSTAIRPLSVRRKSLRPSPNINYVVDNVVDHSQEQLQYGGSSSSSSPYTGWAREDPQTAEADNHHVVLPSPRTNRRVSFNLGEVSANSSPPTPKQPDNSLAATINTTAHHQLAIPILPPQSEVEREENDAANAQFEANQNFYDV